IRAIGSNGISFREHLTCPKNNPSSVRCSKSTPKSSVDGETQVDPPRASLNKSATKCSNIKGSSFIKFEEYVGGFSALSVLKRIYKPTNPWQVLFSFLHLNEHVEQLKKLGKYFFVLLIGNE